MVGNRYTLIILCGWMGALVDGFVFVDGYVDLCECDCKYGSLCSMARMALWVD